MTRMAVRKVRRNGIGLYILFNQYRAYAPVSTRFGSGDRVCVSHKGSYDQHMKVRSDPSSEDFEEWRISKDMRLKRMKDKDHLASLYGFGVFDKTNELEGNI